MRKILWEVKSILNKREKHLRGRHDQRDHNRWPAGYQAQTYTPSDRRSRVAQGRTSAQSSVAMAPRKVKPVPGVAQTSMFDEGFIATVETVKPTREQIFQNIQDKSRKMYTRTDEFATDMDNRMSRLFAGFPTRFTGGYRYVDKAVFGLILTDVFKSINMSLTEKYWHNQFDENEVRGKLSALYDSQEVDKYMLMLEIYADTTRYQEELAKTAEDITNSIKEVVVQYKEKRDEAAKLNDEMKNVELKNKQEFLDFIKQISETSENEDEKNNAQKFVDLHGEIKTLNKNIKELQNAAEQKRVEMEEALKRERKYNAKRRANQGTTFVGGVPGKDFLTLAAEKQKITNQINDLYKEFSAKSIEFYDTKIKLTQSNDEAKEMMFKHNRELVEMETKMNEMLYEYGDSTLYPMLFENLARADGLENVDVLDLDKVFQASSKRNRMRATSLIKSILKLAPKTVFTTYGSPTDVQQFDITIKKAKGNRAQYENEGSVVSPSKELLISGAIAVSDEQNFSTLAHEAVHALQHVLGNAFYMHLYGWINEKLEAKIFNVPGIQYEKLNKITRRRKKGSPYKPYEEGYDGAVTAEYILKRYPSGTQMYDELQEIHTMAITRLLDINENPDAEILPLFLQSVLGMPSDGYNADDMKYYMRSLQHFLLGQKNV
jgi:hypothetical protein